MAEVKWIKLSVDLFSNKKIKQIRNLPNGDSLALMWVFLLCLAGDINDNGMVYFTKEIPYTDEMLAKEFDMDVSTIRLGLATFEKFGMIEIVNSIVYLSAWEKWQAVDKLSEIREYNRIAQQKSREKRRALQAVNDNVNDMSMTCQPCQGTDIDSESDLRTKNIYSSSIFDELDAVSTNKNDVIQERFEQFWKLYPKKVGKGDARKKFLKLKPNQKLFDQILSAVEAAKKTEQWTKNNGQFVPNPATWLNQSRWEDDYSGSMATNSANLDYGEENEYMPF